MNNTNMNTMGIGNPILPTMDAIGSGDLLNTNNIKYRKLKEYILNIYKKKLNNYYI